MSGFLPSFLSSAQLEVRLGNTVLAYCQNLSWTDDMTTVPVGGIGSYSFHSLEPVGYIGRGSMTITHFSSQAYDAVKDTVGALPGNLTGLNLQSGRDGNSLLIKQFFNPVQLIIGRTFDIKVFERAISGGQISTTSRLIYTLKDCRMTNLSLTFTPGSLINQVASFLCLSVIDETAEDTFKTEIPSPIGPPPA